MNEDRRTPEERELDRELANLDGFWTLGLAAEEYATWHDDGMGGVYSERITSSRLGASSGEGLRAELEGMPLERVARALGLSDDVVELAEGEYRRVLLGSRVRTWTRVLLDREREVIVALAGDGVQAGRIELDPEPGVGPGGTTPVVRPWEWAPWELRLIYKAIERESRARRRLYRACERCGRPIPPERLPGEGEERVCDRCRG